MTTPIKAGKTALDATEASMLIEGLDALARENDRMAADAAREGYRPQAQGFANKAARARSLANLGKSAGITKITVQHA
ncbi:MAG: hypothetical protein ACOYB3_01915 [Azonexus sp.]